MHPKAFLHLLRTPTAQMSSPLPRVFRRHLSRSTCRSFKVALVGASGGIGQPLTLLLKRSPLIKHLNLHDLKNTKGVAADASHINTRCQVKAFDGPDQLKDCIKGCHLVVVTGGVPRKPGMTRDDLFSKNAIVVKTVAEAAAAVNPEVFIHIVTNPVNAVVPVAGATYERLGKGKVEHLFGITTLDLVRSNTFIGALKNLDPTKVSVPVVGGHAGETIVPLLSQVKPAAKFGKEEAAKLVTRIQNAGTEVVKAKAGLGSATLSMAYAANRTAVKFLRALKGETMHECCYCRSNVTAAKYFSTPLRLGKNGVEKNLGIPSGITEDEKKMIEKAVKTLQGSAKKGEAYAKK